MKPIARIAFVALALSPGLALGESAPLVDKAQAKPSRVVPAYPSTFKTYRAYQDEPVGVWRDVNAAVGKAGGWRVYAREASQNQPPGASSGGAAK